jgi:hypothetical protein
VNLADYGGVPGAASATIVRAFNRAFNRLKALGGGTLNVGPGIYNIGGFSRGCAISANNLQNVLISAYGAQLTMTTTAKFTPVFLYFSNPNNVTIAGLSFRDFGTNLNVNWWGAICLLVESTMARSGFKTVDCVADSVVTFFQTNQRSNPYLFTGYDINATVSNSYYGIQLSWDGRFSKCNLNCTNVRRAFIGQAAKDWNITVNTNRTGGLGSNAHVVMDAFPNGPVQDNVININASGALDGYVSLGSICHQGGDGVYSYARNIKFNIQVNNATGAATTGFLSFTAEPESGGGIRSSTVSAWENIQINGTVTGPYNGPLVANPSVSSASTNSVYVASKVAALQNMSALPSYFRLITQCSA